MTSTCTYIAFPCCANLPAQIVCHQAETIRLDMPVPNPAQLPNMCMCDAEHFSHNPELHANGRFWCPDASCPKSHSSHNEFAGYTALRKLQMHIKGQQQKNSGHQGLPCKVVAKQISPQVMRVMAARRLLSPASRKQAAGDIMFASVTIP